jgi:hypothetical protein
MIKKIFTNLFLYLAGGNFVLASSHSTLPNPLTATDFTQILQSILSFGIKAGAIVVPIIVVIGAFQMMFAAGNPEKFKTGTKTIVYAVIGYIIILLAAGIIDIVKDVLTSTP